MSTELRNIAQTEFNNHGQEYARLQGLVDKLLTDMEYHARQMSTWQEFLSNLATEGEATVIPIHQDEPAAPLLTLLQGGQNV